MWLVRKPTQLLELLLAMPEDETAEAGPSATAVNRSFVHVRGVPEGADFEPTPRDRSSVRLS